ncbi:DDB1- and CUL4-associated factor 10 homolog [Haliotis rubra]|uniref:DDB1- and CUL4-associated factor 10 homolog n=1 Tax=Haliotis rubra TaxID=36100 RepID=UPI001EE5940E|nr:DDB1- and CUL4-associated factor 10 homolog [Haliotis rubra]XP_046545446.1 DDB1- and CUL4-associated factor 10 homolog [Haliotis rubra]
MYHSSRFSKPACPTSTFMAWKWLQSRETGSPIQVGETSKITKTFYSSMKAVNSWDPNRNTDHCHHGGIFNFDFSADGSMLVAACERQSILVFDPFNGKFVAHKNNAHQDCVNCVRFLDTRTFATCSDDSTVALWDVRNLQQRIQTLEGHSNWVKNIDYASSLGLLVTSGFDGSIYTWDINNYSTETTARKKVFYSNSLMRSKLTPDNSKLIITTAGGFLVIIHDLDLAKLSDDLSGFEPNIYRMMQLNPEGSGLAIMYNKVFERRRNRVEIISDFPAENQAKVIASLQVHPQGWCVVSRNTSADEESEWTCIHNVQEFNEADVPSSPASNPDSDISESTSKDADAQPGSSSNSTGDHYLSGWNILSRSLLSSSIRRFGQVVYTDDLDDDEGDDFDQFPSLSFPFEDRLQLGNGIDDSRRSPLSESLSHDEEDDISLRQNCLIRGSNSVDATATEDDQYTSRQFDSRRGRFVLNTGQNRIPGAASNRDNRTFSNKVHKNKPRLLHYVEEPNVGKGFLKELCFSTDGRIVVSPFGNGVRLLAFDPSCQELCDCVPTRPIKMYEVGSNISHSNVVVTTKFSPVNFMYVSGCLGGKVVFHQPVL